MVSPFKFTRLSSSAATPNLRAELLQLALSEAYAAKETDVYRTYLLTASGKPFANAAFMSGLISLNVTALAEQREIFDRPLSGYVSHLGLTITGAREGNGNFGLEDFNSFFFKAKDVDFDQDLVGQPGFEGLAFGGSDPSAPTASFWSIMSTSQGKGQPLQIMGAVPMPYLIS